MLEVALGLGKNRRLSSKLFSRQRDPSRPLTIFEKIWKVPAITPRPGVIERLAQSRSAGLGAVPETCGL